MSSSSDGEEIGRKISNVNIEEQKVCSNESSFSSLLSHNLSRKSSNSSIDLSSESSTNHSYQETKVKGINQYSILSNVSREKAKKRSFAKELSRESTSKSSIVSSLSRGNTNEYVNSYLKVDSKDASNCESDSSVISESSFNNKYSMDGFEKEDSMLVEREGKFEFIDAQNLKVKCSDHLKKNSKGNQSYRSKPTLKNFEYHHIQSKYAMPELLQEMKKKRVSIIQTRKEEEKHRTKIEQKQKQLAAEKSFQKWLEEKKETKKLKSENLSESVKKPTLDKERTVLAQRAFDEWLQVKQAHQKEEKELEKLRLADEAQYYVIRDRGVCNKAFKEWLQKKEANNQKKQSSVRPPKRIKSKLFILGH